MIKRNISVIIPFNNKAYLTINAVKSLLKFSSKDVCEIILVDNKSNQLEISRLRNAINKILQQMKSKCSIRILKWSRSFNWQKVNNFAAKRAVGNILCFLNNDIVFTEKSHDILRCMANRALKKNIGVVGCLMLYPNGQVQHAGGYPERGAWFRHYMGKMKSIYRHDRTLPYVTGACHVISKRKFWQLSGYDSRFQLFGGDIDLCARATVNGWNNFYIGSRSMLHREGNSRSNYRYRIKDFRLLYYSLINSSDSFERQTSKTVYKFNNALEIEKYYCRSLRNLKRDRAIWIKEDKSNVMELVPTVPFVRKPRLVILIDQFKSEHEKTIKNIQNSMSMSGVLVIAYRKPSIKTHIRILEAFLLGNSKNLLTLDCMQQDVFVAERKFIHMLKRNFPNNKMISIM